MASARARRPTKQATIGHLRRALAATPTCPELFSLDPSEAQARGEARKRGMRLWCREVILDSLTRAQHLAYLLATQAGSLAGLFLTLCSYRAEETFSADDWNSAVLSYLGMPAPGLESLVSDTNPLASSALTRSSAEHVATHDLIRDVVAAIGRLAGVAVQLEVTGLFGALPPGSDGEPPPGTRRLGIWRRMDLVVHFVKTGVTLFLDFTTP